jgi:TRAP-type C4-dicarboxylate transport system permease small subunit
MDRFVRIVRAISLACGIAGAGLIALGVLTVCHMVFVRYVLGQNTIWQTDLTTYALIGATFIGSPYVLMTRGHVNVDVLPVYLGPRGRFRLAVFAAVVGIAFCATLTVLSAMLWYDAWDRNWVSDTMWRAPLWMPYASMPVGLFILTLQYVADFGNLLRGREPPFGIKPTEETR